ncbi:MAG: hypothetical protein BroJett014_03810 [Planctomycetota bacterium]|nr:MAG: hypothetical protein BroJett014_03810 [Planctomycetota bacterium]
MATGAYCRVIPGTCTVTCDAAPTYGGDVWIPGVLAGHSYPLATLYQWFGYTSPPYGCQQQSPPPPYFPPAPPPPAPPPTPPSAAGPPVEIPPPPPPPSPYGPPVEIPPPVAPGYQPEPSPGLSAVRPISIAMPRPISEGEAPEYPSLAAGTRISVHPSLSGLIGAAGGDASSAYLGAAHPPQEEMPPAEPPAYWVPPAISHPPYAGVAAPAEDRTTVVPDVTFIDPISGKPRGAGQTASPEAPEPLVRWGELTPPTFLGNVIPPAPLDLMVPLRSSSLVDADEQIPAAAEDCQWTAAVPPCIIIPPCSISRDAFCRAGIYFKGPKSQTKRSWRIWAEPKGFISFQSVVWDQAKAEYVIEDEFDAPVDELSGDATCDPAEPVVVAVFGKKGIGVDENNKCHIHFRVDKDEQKKPVHVLEIDLATAVLVVRRTQLPIKAVVSGRFPSFRLCVGPPWMTEYQESVDEKKEYKGDSTPLVEITTSLDKTKQSPCCTGRFGNARNILYQEDSLYFELDPRAKRKLERDGYTFPHKGTRYVTRSSNTNPSSPPQGDFDGDADAGKDPIPFLDWLPGKDTATGEQIQPPFAGRSSLLISCNGKEVQNADSPGGCIGLDGLMKVRAKKDNKTETLEEPGRVVRWHRILRFKEFLCVKLAFDQNCNTAARYVPVLETTWECDYDVFVKYDRRDTPSVDTDNTKLRITSMNAELEKSKGQPCTTSPASKTKGQYNEEYQDSGKTATQSSWQSFD